MEFIDESTQKTFEFNKGDKVEVKPSAIHYSNDLKNISKYTLEVDYIKEANLGDMSAMVVYFKTDLNTDKITIIKNPYLLEHFQKKK